jgi:hypothetical protein
MSPAARHEIIAMMFGWATGIVTGWLSHVEWARRPKNKGETK